MFRRARSRWSLRFILNQRARRDQAGVRNSDLPIASTSIACQWARIPGNCSVLARTTKYPIGLINRGLGTLMIWLSVNATSHYRVFIIFHFN